MKNNRNLFLFACIASISTIASLSAMEIEISKREEKPKIKENIQISKEKIEQETKRIIGTSSCVFNFTIKDLLNRTYAITESSI